LRKLRHIDNRGNGLGSLLVFFRLAVPETPVPNGTRAG